MKEYKNKLFISTLFLIQVFLILVGRLVYLQIIKGNEFEVFSKENRIRLLKTQSPRGKILDRFGRELVINRASFDIKLFPNEIEDLDQISKDPKKKN